MIERVNNALGRIEDELDGIVSDCQVSVPEVIEALESLQATLSRTLRALRAM